MAATRLGAVLCLGLAVLLAACSGGGRSVDQPSPSASEAPRAPKLLIIGVQGEPITFVPIGNVRSAAGTADAHVRRLAHDTLTRVDERGATVAMLATDVIAVERGNWRVNADGTMDTTWTINPGVRWHDGTTFTSADLLFSFRVHKDPSIPNLAGIGATLMESAQAPDPQTLLVHWSSVYFAADAAPGLIPLPRHLLEDLYERDRDAFMNTPLFKSEWVGLGPFRLTAWEPGAHMEFARFDDYYGGRALVDMISMRFLNDPNTMVANILAEAVDVLLPISVRVDDALEVKRRWDGTGNQVVADLSGRLRHVELQHRPEVARPLDGMTNPLVRQAMYQGIDRRTLADVMNPGLNAQIADSWIPPNHELRPDVESAIPQFPYDPARAQQLLAQAGWTRSSGGVLTNQASGEPFRFQLWNTQSSGAEREMNALADNWKSLGVDVELYIIPTPLLNDRQHRASLSGGGLSGAGFDGWTTDRLHSKQITSAANNWIGTNRGGYSNPKVDAILDRLAVTIPRAERVALHRQLLQEQMGDVASMPLFWDLDPILMLRGVRGIAVESGSLNGNVLQWAKD
jgi:peptide/nickel transport system substrate-binding protein